MKVIQLHPHMDAGDVSKALRNIADDIDAGRYDFAPNLAAVVLARETTRRTQDSEDCAYQWQTHGLGLGATVFRVRGLLSTAATQFDGSSE